MKIAFLSCFDSKRVESQPVWAVIAEKNPDVLLLLGDNIYMDYGFFSNKKIIKYTDDYFLTDMYKRYKANWENSAFKSLVLQTKQIYTTWDDHDFAWNNAEGLGSAKVVVPVSKKRIARALHMQFRNFLANCNASSEYPTMPTLAQTSTQPDVGIEYSSVLPATDNNAPIRLLLSDSRYYREAKRSLLGAKQQEWIIHEMNNSEEEIKILCSGSTLNHEDQSWKAYSDYSWFTSKNFKNFIVLTGDIHKSKIVQHTNKDGTTFNEFICSGAASPNFIIKGSRNRWGLIEVNGKRLPDVKISLYKGTNVEYQGLGAKKS